MLSILACLPLFFAVQGQAPLETARAAMASGEPARAVELLSEWLQEAEGNGPVLALLGEALGETEQFDSAAHALALALKSDDLDKRSRTAAERLLRRFDPLAREGQRLVDDAVKNLYRSVQKLGQSGHTERSLALAERIHPFARDTKIRRDLEQVIERRRARSLEVNLEGGTGKEGNGSGTEAEDDEDSDFLPLEIAESEHYRLECNLEPEVIERLGRTMDAVFAFYVEVYFGGDTARVNKRKATLRIHPDRATMLEGWTDPDRNPGGWWSPSEWRVYGYDTRSDGTSLDAMLETLFHEASHQFMTMMTDGASAPSWLNEGTASFFEGTLAMADGRVLWPDVAPTRLWSLASFLGKNVGPTLQTAVLAPPDATEEAELTLLEADLLERRGATESAAAALEMVLDLVQEGRYPIAPERIEELEERMLRLDRGNAPVRRLRLLSENLRKRSERLLSRYDPEEDTWLLRARDLAETCAVLLDSPELGRRATDLRRRAIVAGRIAPRRLAVDGERWISIFSGQEQHFRHDAQAVALAIPGRIAGRICTDLPILPTYGVSAILRPEGEIYRSSYHGLVVAGSPDELWYSVGVSGGRDLVVKRVERRASGSTRLRNVHKQRLGADAAAAFGGEGGLALSIQVRADSTLAIDLGPDGSSAGTPIEVSLPEPLPNRASVGILVKDAALVLNSLRVEFLP